MNKTIEFTQSEINLLKEALTELSKKEIEAAAMKGTANYEKVGRISVLYESLSSGGPLTRTP